MKNRIHSTAAAPALSMVGFGLTGCGRETKETAAKTKAADKQAGGVQATDTQTNGDQAEGDQEEGSRTADDKGYKATLCLSGAASDMGWCQSAYDGLKPLEVDYGCEVTYMENLTPDDIKTVFAGHAASGYGVVISHGYKFGDPTMDATEQYLDTKFIITEGEVSTGNVASYASKREEGGHTMGMLVAGMSESDRVGLIGPIQGASLVKIMNGSEDGAKEVNSDIQAQTTWTSSFIDTALGKEATQTMTDSGANVIGRRTSESGTGAINVAEKTKVYATGDPYNQNDLAPDTILSSPAYHISHVIEATFKTVTDRTFEGGINQLGMTDGAVSVAPYRSLDSVIPDELKQKISDKIAAIESGAFETTRDTKPRT